MRGKDISMTIKLRIVKSSVISSDNTRLESQEELSIRSKLQKSRSSLNCRIMIQKTLWCYSVVIWIFAELVASRSAKEKSAFLNNGFQDS